MLITMKRVATFLSLCMTFLFASCAGDIDRTVNHSGIELDKGYVSFNADGGSHIITNLTKKWLNIIDAAELIFDENERRIVYPNIYEAEEGLVNLSYDEKYLDGRWFHLSIPEPPYSHTLIVEIEPNNTGKTRRLHVCLRSADYYSEIKIEQQ